MQQRMKNQQGFGIIEVVVAMGLLVIATLAMVQWFGINRNSELTTAIGMKDLQAQRVLERSIWSMYDNHCTLRLQPDGITYRCTIDIPGVDPNQLPDLKPCDISTTTNKSYIALTDSGTCSPGTENSPYIKARITKLGCTSNASSSQAYYFTSTTNTLRITNCTNSAVIVENINDLKNKNEYQVTLRQHTAPSSPLVKICTLQNIGTAASTPLANELSLSLNCGDCESEIVRDGGCLQTGQVLASFPGYSIKLFSKERIYPDREDQGFNGYHRFYY